MPAFLKENNTSMGKKAPTGTSGPQMSITIREASTGKKHTNAKSLLKLQHIKNLAAWASRDAAIPSLGAFFGHHFAASSEALGTPVDTSLFTCQRCETILEPGYNCTIRIEKSKNNKGKKATAFFQNNVVYTCHFCSHRNMKRGTLSSKERTVRSRIHDHKTSNSVASTKDDPKGKLGIPEMSETSKVKDESTPLTLLESKMRKRNRSGAKKTMASESASKTEKSANRRQRKSWTSLKEIAERSDSRRFMDLTVPFSMQ